MTANIVVRSRIAIKFFEEFVNIYFQVRFARKAILKYFRKFPMCKFYSTKEMPTYDRLLMVSMSLVMTDGLTDSKQEYTLLSSGLTEN